MGLHELAHQVDIGRIFDLQQDNRQIAGDGVAPKTGLSPAILYEDARIGSQRIISVDDRAGKAAVKLRVCLRGIDLPQEHLAVCPCQIEDAIRETPILVFFNRLRHASRVSPMPVTIFIVADFSGSSVIRHRMATIGSSTEPWLPESAPEGPMNRSSLADRRQCFLGR